MTSQEGAIISAYTGILIGSFGALHKYVELILARPVFTHELGNKEIEQEIKEKSENDFMALCGDITDE